MKQVVILDGVRSPIGKFGGGLSSIRPDDLLAHVYKGLMARTGVDPVQLEDVYAGCGNQAGEDNRDVARMSVLLAGFPQEVSGVTVNRNCSSALEAVNQAAKAVLAEEGDLFIGSGVESMSRAPWAMSKPDRTPQLGHPKMWDTTVGWRFNNKRLDEIYPIVSLGETAENIAEEMQITREEQDAFAVLVGGIETSAQPAESLAEAIALPRRQTCYRGRANRPTCGIPPVGRRQRLVCHRSTRVLTAIGR